MAETLITSPTSLAVLVLMASCCVLTVAHMLHDRLLAQAQEMTLLGSHGARAAATHQARRAGPVALQFSRLSPRPISPHLLARQARASYFLRAVVCFVVLTATGLALYAWYYFSIAPGLAARLLTDSAAASRLNSLLEPATDVNASWTYL